MRLARRVRRATHRLSAGCLNSKVDVIAFSQISRKEDLMLHSLGR
jgi:hypothetical protein